MKEIKHHSSRQDALEDNEFEELISKCKTKKELFMVLTLGFTGMRADELSHFKPSWIKWQKEIIQIPPTDNGWKPKTKAGARTIPIKEPRLKEILEWWSFQNQMKSVKFNRITVWRIIGDVANRTKIQKKIYPHSLRATYATKLAFKGMSPSTIQHIMGWATINTANEYVQSSGARSKQEFMEKW